jgi:hypothetical protein
MLARLPINLKPFLPSASRASRIHADPNPFGNVDRRLFRRI